ncbi:MAG: hypothetical protein GY765_28580 [bacterium]|nr:hypothetical protein [bacterium]
MSDTDIFFDAPPIGEAVVAYFALPENCTVTGTTIEPAGEAYTGNLNRESFGTTVSPAGAGGASDIFIVDFHAFRTVIAVGLLNTGVTISSVYMWLGTNFFTTPTDGAINPDLLTNNPKTQYPYTYFDEVNTPKIKVQLSAALSPADFKEKFIVLGRSFPLNLRAKLGDEDSFWAAPGEFSKKASLPPLAESLNRLKEKGDYGESGIPLVLFSDAPGNVTVPVNAIGCRLEKILVEGNETAKVQLKASEPEEGNTGTVTAGIVLPGFNAGGAGTPAEEKVDTSEAVTLTSPPIGLPGSQIRLDQIGFDLEGVILSDFSVKVSPVFTAAIKLEPVADLSLHGFKLLLGKDVSADLQLLAEIQAAREGKPSADDVLASAPIEIDKTPLEQDSWVEVLFPEAVDLTAENIYWIVVKSKTGNAQWKGRLPTAGGAEEKTTGQFMYSKNAGLTWRNHIVSGFFMPTVEPSLVDNSRLLAVTFSIDGGTPKQMPVIYAKEVAQTETLTALNKTITLDDEGKIDLTLRVTARQAGIIRLSKVFVDYAMEL